MTLSRATGLPVVTASHWSGHPLTSLTQLSYPPLLLVQGWVVKIYSTLTTYL